MREWQIIRSGDSSVEIKSILYVLQNIHIYAKAKHYFIVNVDVELRNFLNKLNLQKFKYLEVLTHSRMPIEPQKFA